MPTTVPAEVFSATELCEREMSGGTEVSIVWAWLELAAILAVAPADFGWFDEVEEVEVPAIASAIAASAGFLVLAPTCPSVLTGVSLGAMGALLANLGVDC